MTKKWCKIEFSSSLLQRENSLLCVPRTSSGVLRVRPGNIGDEGRQEQVVM